MKFRRVAISVLLCLSIVFIPLYGFTSYSALAEESLEYQKIQINDDTTVLDISNVNNYFSVARGRNNQIARQQDLAKQLDLPFDCLDGAEAITI